MPRIDEAIEQIDFARRYTLQLLDHVDLQDWFRQPSEGVTHVAWQVGHLAAAEYRLALERIRGVRPADEALISDSLLALFGKNSTPQADPACYPPPEEIRELFDRVHQQVKTELAETPDALLDEQTAKPHPAFKTKGGALRWCANHEMLHAGQIGLLRRLFGNPPIR